VPAGKRLSSSVETVIASGAVLKVVFDDMGRSVRFRKKTGAVWNASPKA
jgi:hypothetical protein